MSSSIFWRFKSQKDPVQITFDGTSLSVFEVKRDIIIMSKLGDGTDFDLEIYTSDTNEKYDDDTTQIPRSTTVIARRIPAVRTGAGKAARYVTGKMPVNAKNAHRIESTANAAGKSTPVLNGANNSGKELTEEERLQAILNANDQAFKSEQEAMSHKPVVRNYNKSAAVPDKPLPPGYICHRCGEKGHWIQACPTNNDPNFDNRPKFKRTTGIPRSFLKVVEKPAGLGEDGKIDLNNVPKGVMYTANGEWVVAEADHATWDKIQEKQNAAAAKAKEISSELKEIRDRGLECTLHEGIFVSPVKTPCCGTTYCHDCAEKSILDNDLSCPNCGEQVLLDQLEPDDGMLQKIKAYEDERKAETNLKLEDAGKSPAAGVTPKGNSPKAESVQSPATVPEVKIDSANSAASTPTSKKRAADGELPNHRKPSNPATNMKKTNSNQGTAVPTQASSNTSQPVQPPSAPAAERAEFEKTMKAMQASMAGMQNGVPAMVNPMMGGFNPAMMGMNMNMGMNPMMGMSGMGMPNFGGMNGMQNMNGMRGLNGWNGGNQMGGGNWQQGGAGRGGTPQGGGGSNDSPYMRQPVNSGRQRGRFSRQRSTDYRQL